MFMEFGLVSYLLKYDEKIVIIILIWILNLKCDIEFEDTDGEELTATFLPEVAEEQSKKYIYI